MNGYFDPDALAILQEAYALQLNNPEDQDFDQTSGLPTGVVSNTSPWHGQMDLWKYPDGKNPLETAPIMFYGDEEDDVEDYDDDEETYEEEDEDGYIEEAMTDDEVDALIEELLTSEEDED